jgi:hypothetical protein
MQSEKRKTKAQNLKLRKYLYGSATNKMETKELAKILSSSILTLKGKNKF